MRKLIRSFRLRVRSLVKRRQLERDLQDELAYHMELRRANASSQAPFGNVTSIQEACRDLWTFSRLEDLSRDVRHAVRLFGRAPGHTAAIVLLLALGVGANTALFSLFNAAFIRELPVPHPEELVVLNRVDTNGRFLKWSAPGFEEFQRRQTSFGSVFAVGGAGVVEYNLGAEGVEAPDFLYAGIASGNLFQALGLRAAIGRLFTDEDDRFESPNPVVVLGDKFWRDLLGADSNVIGRVVTLSGNAFTVVGVLPAEFIGFSDEAFWVPISAQHLIEPGFDRRNPGFAWLKLMGRLKADVSLQQAQSEAEVLHSHLLAERKLALQVGQKAHVRLDPGTKGFGDVQRQFGRPLQILMGAAVLLLLVVCANVASLLLARGGSRQREIAVRLALGCGRARLVRQFLIESGLLATCGGAIGLALAPAGTRFLVAIAPPGAALGLDPTIDTTVLLFTLASSAGAAILFGLAPALRASQVAIDPALKSASRTVTGPRFRLKLNRFFVAVQVALSVALVAGSVLFGQSLYRLYTMDPGFDRKNLITVTIPTSRGYQSSEPYVLLSRQLSERLSALPGVRSVTIGVCGILSGCNNGWGPIVMEGSESSNGGVRLQVNHVSRTFFETLRIPLGRGRSIRAEDSFGSPPVAVVNEAFQRTYFPGQPAVGKRFGFKGQPPIEIVGVVKNSKYNDLRENAIPMAFVPLEQFPRPFNFILLKADGPPESLFPAVRGAILDIDPKLRPQIRTMNQVVDNIVSLDILLARLSGLFGSVALLIACFGVYGVISNIVVSRTPEIGIRLALGAQPVNVRRQVIADAIKTVAPGIVLGIAIALASERFVKSLLFEAMDRDLLVYGAVSLALMLATALAAYLPAYRASHIDPVNALRCE